MKTIFYLPYLMQAANKVGQAKLQGTREDVETAERELKIVERLFLMADEVHLGYTCGDLQ